MAFVLNDRVKETSTSTSTGAMTFAGAVSGFETFLAGIGNSNTTYYVIAHQTANEWEVGHGTLAADSSTLTRTNVYTSSNSDSAVNFSAGTKDIFCSLPASKAVFKDASDNTNFADDEKVQLGTSNDLKIYHDGSNSFIDQTGGTGEIVLKAASSRSTLLTNSSGQNIIAAGPAIAYLYNSGSVKLETTGTGVQTTGTINVNGAYTMPTTDGSANQILETDGGGAVTFVAKPTSGASAGFAIAMAVAL